MYVFRVDPLVLGNQLVCFCFLLFDNPVGLFGVASMCTNVMLCIGVWETYCGHIISCRSLPVEVLGSLTHTITSSVNSKNLTSSFPI